MRSKQGRDGDEMTRRCKIKKAVMMIRGMLDDRECLKMRQMSVCETTTTTKGSCACVRVCVCCCDGEEGWRGPKVRAGTYLCVLFGRRVIVRQQQQKQEG